MTTIGQIERAHNIPYLLDASQPVDSALDLGLDAMLRASPHDYSTEAEIDGFVAMVAQT